MQGITVCRFVLSAAGRKYLALEPEPLQTSITMPSPATSLSPPIPLSNDKATLLAQLAEGLDGEHLWWLSGYIAGLARAGQARSEEHTSELQSLMRISYAVFCLKKKNNEHDHI